MQIAKLKHSITKIYRGCSSYQDFGRMDETKLGRQERAKRLEFTTWFSAPTNFRFDFISFDPTGKRTGMTSVWANEDGVFLWNSGIEVKQISTLVGGLKVFVELLD